MKSHLDHLQVNIDFGKNISFYKDLMELMGWQLRYQDESMAGYKPKEGTGDIWFLNTDVQQNQNYDHKGVNHISVRVEEMEDVDTVVNFLNDKNIKSLFETPRHRPDFANSPEETYYQVMFESPDKILFEVVYIGAK